MIFCRRISAQYPACPLISVLCVTFLAFCLSDILSFFCSSAAGARRGCCAFAVHETAAGALVLHGIGSPCTCTCVDVYWIVIARVQRQCQYAGYPCELLCSQRLLPPQHVPPPRFAVHEAAAGAVRLHGIGSPCTCVHVPLIVIARLSLHSWHLRLCHWCSQRLLPPQSWQSRGHH